MTKVSIIIPVYNVKDYIEECIQSVINQTYSNIEILLIDDCGTDESVSIAARVLCAQSRFDYKILYHNYNRGLSAARNTGIDAATGDFVYFLDSDDWIIPRCIELLVRMSKQYPKSDLIQGGALVSDNSIPWFDLEKASLPEHCADRYLIKTQLLGREQLPVTSWNKLVRLSLIKKNRLYFVEGLIHEDIVWNNLLAKYVEELSVLHFNTYIYRIRGNSIKTSGKEFEAKRMLHVYALLIRSIDSMYRKEQIDWIIFLLDRMYFENNTVSIRKEIGLLANLLSSYCSYPLSLRLKAKGLLAQLCDSWCSKVSYYFFYQLSCDKTLLEICIASLKKIFHS